MILGFKWQFEGLILEGTKIHTIRVDAGRRWNVGQTIHFATGVRTKDYNCFKVGVCTGVQEIRLLRVSDGGGLVRIDDRLLTEKAVADLARCDGFGSVEAFWKWFDEPFVGRLIHWAKRPPVYVPEAS